MDAYVGEIRMFGGTYAPVGWVLCDGSLLSISANETLFTLLGTLYGGDGQSTFGVPDLRGRAPMHKSMTHPQGQLGGVETVTLSRTQLAMHSHTPVVSGASGTSSAPTQAHWAGNSDYACYSSAAPNAQFNGQAIGVAGGSDAHDNMMPFSVINFIIATEGIYPQQA